MANCREVGVRRPRLSSKIWWAGNYSNWRHFWQGGSWPTMQVVRLLQPESFWFELDNFENPGSSTITIANECHNHKTFVRKIWIYLRKIRSRVLTQTWNLQTESKTTSLLCPPAHSATFEFSLLAHIMQIWLSLCFQWCIMMDKLASTGFWVHWMENVWKHWEESKKIHFSDTFNGWIWAFSDRKNIP